ncbi:hypothetical protein [Micromonospora auratinigra]|uniref:Uncharacterized protein n=1 Tax=Micromonospora auratinigra TaxID=261654 RepID=A0A1A9A075_9ACTN|nr:hypothetical protein [Micromonospora auratinigra]SBT49493.1 hypothetical protein GA0070611_4442 [Micromonospora auratinigra]
MSFVSPQQLAQDRVVNAKAVLAGEVDLRAYPYRHLVVLARHSWTSSGFPTLMAAVEHLSNYGWEMINLTSVGEGHNLYAAMRRTA